MGLAQVGMPNEESEKSGLKTTWLVRVSKKGGRLDPDKKGSGHKSHFRKNQSIPDIGRGTFTLGGRKAKVRHVCIGSLVTHQI